MILEKTKNKKGFTQHHFGRAQNGAGFTLIETLVSILIFSVSIVALISITAGGVSDTGFVKKKQTAYLLAQEGVEVLRFMRDSSIRSGDDWATFNSEISGAGCTGDGCTVDSYRLAGGDPVLPTIDNCNGQCPVMKYDPLSGYQYSYGTKTDFVRTIKLNKVPGGHANEIEIYSEVSWQHGGDPFSVVLREVITNWVRPSPSS